MSTWLCSIELFSSYCCLSDMGSSDINESCAVILEMCVRIALFFTDS